MIRPDTAHKQLEWQQFIDYVNEIGVGSMIHRLFKDIREQLHSNVEIERILNDDPRDIDGSTADRIEIDNFKTLKATLKSILFRAEKRVVIMSAFIKPDMNTIGIIVFIV